MFQEYQAYIYRDRISCHIDKVKGRLGVGLQLGFWILPLIDYLILTHFLQATFSPTFSSPLFYVHIPLTLMVMEPPKLNPTYWMSGIIDTLQMLTKLLYKEGIEYETEDYEK